MRRSRSNASDEIDKSSAKKLRIEKMSEVPLTTHLLHVKHPNFNSVSEIHAIKYCLSTIGGYLEDYEILICNKEEIKRCLSSLDDKDQSNIAILVGDTSFSNLTLSDIVYAAIKEVADDNITDELNELLLDLTEKLKLTFNRAICRIRGQTLMINMCGPYKYVMAFLEEAAEEMLQIIFMMGSYEPNELSSKNNNCDVSDENTNLDEMFPLHLSDEKTVQPEKECSVEAVYRKSMETCMMTVQNALHTIRIIICKKERNIYRTRITTVNTNDAQGKILASDILSTVSVPSYEISTKHGYAVLASDGKGIRKVLATSQIKNIGASFFLVSGTCVRIRSGEPIPTGATAVVKLEDTMIMEDNVNDNDYFDMEDKEYEINISITPEIDENIRNIGYEIELDDHVLRKYNRIGPAELNILTLCGFNSVEIIGQPSVGLLSIGNELVEPGNNLTPGRTYDSNRITLISLLREKDFHNTVDFGISPYEYRTICDKVGDALEKVDVLVIMGHANDRDILKTLLIKSYNAVIHFGRVNMKPGKSTTFATCKFNDKNKYFLCMSANPVTVPIVARIFLITLLNCLRCYHFQDPVLQTCMMSRQELHTRAKYLWTTIIWNTEGKEVFSRAHFENRQNEMKHPKANGILMLPQRAPDLSFLDAAFVQAIYFGK